MNQADYTDNPKKGRSWIKIGIGIAALLGFSACTWMFVGMLGESLEFQKTATAFIEETEGGKFPPAKEWSPEAKITDDDVTVLSDYIAAYGTVKEIETPNCSVNAYAGTEQLNGRFVTCTAQTSYSNGSGETKIIWRKEDDEWMLLGYHTDFGPDNTEAQSEAETPGEDKGKED